jgi:hypothetical protein
MTRKLTQDEFIKRAKTIHKNKFDYSLVNYINKRTKIKLKCNMCKNIFEQLPSNHITGSGCFQCRIDSIKLAIDEFINKANEIHENKYDYELVNYINNKTKVKIKCNKCLIIFEQTPNGHMSGRGCTQCDINNKTKTLEQFIIESKLIHNNKYDYSLTEYINSYTKVKIKCNKCLIIFEQLPNNHLLGQDCLDCVNKSKTPTINEFINKAKLIHKDKYNYDLVEYINSRIKIQIKCNTCNKIFEQVPYSHLSGSGCPNCRFSKGETKCQEILENIEYVKVISQYKFDDCINIRPLPFDFKVILNNDKYFLIEFNGEQHYLDNHWDGVNLEDIQKRDKI